VVELREGNNVGIALLYVLFTGGQRYTLWDVVWSQNLSGWGVGCAGHPQAQMKVYIVRSNLERCGGMRRAALPSFFSRDNATKKMAVMSIRE